MPTHIHLAWSRIDDRKHHWDVVQDSYGQLIVHFEAQQYIGSHSRGFPSTFLSQSSPGARAANREDVYIPLGLFREGTYPGELTDY
ncbi:MAG: hypothetical protein A2Y72_06925 [Chloroflexi bacterium RBG_13_53_26]|nr:MAG: hypothetical protein A2Y72_06925 [Chloroflexi bacterium RBG_13_53_26]